MKREFRFSFMYVCMYILTLDVPKEASPLTRYSRCFWGLVLVGFHDVKKKFKKYEAPANTSNNVSCSDGFAS